MARSRNKPGPWALNLYERKGYYSWKNPLDGREYGIGRDRKKAISQATEANLHVAGLIEQRRLVHRIEGDAQTVGAWLDKYDDILAKKKLSPKSRPVYKSLSKLMLERLGADTMMRAVKAKKVSDILEAIGEAEGKPSRAVVLRSFMHESFRVAITKGWIDEGKNPVSDTVAHAGETKRARLTFEVFMSIYQRTAFDWLRNGMAVALVSAQRREDIALAETTEFHDGGWWVEQGKGHPDKGGQGRGGTRVFIPLTLRLERFGMSLEDVYKQCRATRVFSRFLIHQTVNRGSNSPVGSRIRMDAFSNRFAEEVAALGLDWGKKDPSTFHEIRSLSERMYSEQGNVDTQLLLGHKSKRTTERYHDARGAEWVRVQVRAV